MVDGTTPEETRAAIGLLTNDGVTGRHGRGAEWIGGPEDCDGGKSDGRRNVHCARIVANKNMAMGKKRGQIDDGSLAG